MFATFIGASNAQIEAVESLCVSLCDRTGDQLAACWLAYCSAIHLAMRPGRPEAALAELDRFLAIMSAESFPTTGYDRAWGQCWRASCLWLLGRVAEAGELAGAQLEDVLARGDHTVSTLLTQTFCFGLMARGRVEQIERLLEEARSWLRPGEITTADSQWLYARMTTSVYAHCAVEVWKETAEHRERFFNSWTGRMLSGGAMYLTAAGTAAAAALAVSDPEQRRSLQREARRLVRRAGKSPAATEAVVPGTVLLACLDGDRERAIAALRQSIEACGYPLMRHVRGRRLGELLGGDEGAALIAEADAFLRAGGVVDPARFTAAFTPGVSLPKR
jgi:hypothetical protein